MAPGQLPPRQDHVRGSYLTASDAPVNARRRSVAIHDLLNPVNRDEDRGPQQTPEPARSSGSNQGHRWSRRSRSTSGSRGSPRRRGSPSSSAGRPSPPRERQRRSFRPTYSEEEVDFLWYHRVDLAWEWNDILLAFNRQFPGNITREVSGIQCKYYRHLENRGMPQVRQRDRAASVQAYGMRAHTGRWYPWMHR
ncbi:MAG: hypothetical protein L6R39_003280 [Caloplaca ligustica]|nr:MAG: hypothetical protein L6R39_003280 [Caloplaca ligustica]